jgi:DNA-binding response OmpR family regulator
MLQTSSILIMDQEPTIADLLVEILTDAGYVAYTAPNDTSALAAIAHHPPALLLLDVEGPGASNPQRVETMRQASLVTIPIVVTTTAPRNAALLLVSAAVECLAKPFDLDDLLACVARYVQPHTTVPASRVQCLWG